ncbi:MAG: hypothetical protein ACE5ER_07245 [Nitrospinaceae bacterium]
MLIQENLVLTRAEPNGNGGLQFLYRVRQYGVACCSAPKEDVTMINWEADVIKFKNQETLQFDVCHNTKLADHTLTFRNDKGMNDFLQKAFLYFEELNQLEKMMES